jgi:formate dehydrogenase subunit delta
MANQIAANFLHHGPEVAASEVAAHLKRFWAPPMRAELLANLDDGRLDPIVVRAGELLRELESAGSNSAS